MNATQKNASDYFQELEKQRAAVSRPSRTATSISRTWCRRTTS